MSQNFRQLSFQPLYHRGRIAVFEVVNAIIKESTVKKEKIFIEDFEFRS